MKTMKKSMFITTIMMVVLLVVALSTATFAWYTAQSNVAVTETTVTSATSSAASIAIDSTGGATSTNTSIAITMNKEIAPMVPFAAPTNATTYANFTTTTAANETGFYTAPINAAGNFTANGSAIAPAVIATAKGTAQNYFYVINTNGTNDAEVKVSVKIDTNGYTVLTQKPNDWVANKTTKYYTRTKGVGDAADTYARITDQTTEFAYAEGNDYSNFYVKNDVIASKLRVAVFAGETDAATSTYIATWSLDGGANTHYGKIEDTKTGTLTDVFESKSSDTKVALATISPLANRVVTVVAWFDGVDLDVNDSAMPAVFTINFDC